MTNHEVIPFTADELRAIADLKDAVEPDPTLLRYALPTWPNGPDADPVSESFTARQILESWVLLHTWLSFQNVGQR